LFYWYRQLKTLETSLDQSLSADQLADRKSELDRIDAAVSRLRVPVPFSDELYDLRGHIDLIGRRLDRRAPNRPINAAA
jgi:hypothetical protein